MQIISRLSSWSWFSIVWAEQVHSDIRIRPILDSSLPNLFTSFLFLAVKLECLKQMKTVIFTLKWSSLIAKCRKNMHLWVKNLAPRFILFLSEMFHGFVFRSVRPDKRFRLALGSFVEEYNNKVQVNIRPSFVAKKVHDTQQDRSMFLQSVMKYVLSLFFHWMEKNVNHFSFIMQSLRSSFCLVMTDQSRLKNVASPWVTQNLAKLLHVFCSRIPYYQDCWDVIP